LRRTSIQAKESFGYPYSLNHQKIKLEKDLENIRDTLGSETGFSISSPYRATIFSLIEGEGGDIG